MKNETGEKKSITHYTKKGNNDTTVLENRSMEIKRKHKTILR